MAAPSSPDPAPTVLPDELVEDCLLRVPPDDPADLARAALVSRQWHRVVTGAVFRRRYIAFHRTAPLLGYIVNLDDSTRFVPTSSFRPPQAQASRRDVRAIDSGHGRVLLRCFAWDREAGGNGLRLLVWDPSRDKQWELPVLQPRARLDNCAAALVCAAVGFKVVCVGRLWRVWGGSEWRRFSCFYSSEAGTWSDLIFVPGEGVYGGGCHVKGSVLVGNAFYYKMRGAEAGGIVLAAGELRRPLPLLYSSRPTRPRAQNVFHWFTR